MAAQHRALIVHTFVTAAFTALMAGCAPHEGPPGPAPGALVRVSAQGQVGVLLDEVPASIRERVARELLREEDSFWRDRARRQLALATYRLNFRAFFYDEAEAKRALPLPPEQVQQISLAPHARRAQLGGHDYVLTDYALDTLLVTDLDSAGSSEPALAAVGGSWTEPFVFPADPELLLQRTGFACMDEFQYPPNSVDSENTEFFYDQDCDVEEALTPDGCHFTQLATQSCQDAVAEHVGRVDMNLLFERIPWNEALAARARVGTVSNPDGVDLEVVSEELDANRLIYRYIGPTSCAVEENCVTGLGWRRLLQFNASEKNTGSAALHIGDVDYFVDNPDSPTDNDNHHIYEYSACHNHYHFSHYAAFGYGSDNSLGTKRAFCLESVARYGNHEQSPLWSPYNDCAYQGITPGWGDQYQAGIECQWLDVTTVDTGAGPVTRPLSFRSNPDGFLCEGQPVLDESGAPVWEATPFRTPEGDTVDRPQCTFQPDWERNNLGARDVTLPLPGEGMVTGECTRGQLGKLRNCGFTARPELLTCAAGSVELRCTLPPGSAPQVVRACEASAVLGAGTACTASDALANADVDVRQPLTLTVTCPTARSLTEPGGLYALYTAPAFPRDQGVAVTCTVQAPDPAVSTPGG
jgi:hypothetical protein